MSKSPVCIKCGVGMWLERGIWICFNCISRQQQRAAEHNSSKDVAGMWQRIFGPIYQTWGFHNLVGHPLMQILRWFRLTNLANAVHDGTVPVHERDRVIPAAIAQPTHKPEPQEYRAQQWVN